MASRSSRLTPQIVFGLGDGCMSILGVVLYASGHPRLVIWAALSGALSASASMGLNEWLSDSGNGFSGAAAMAAATLAGTVLPALPYTVLRGLPAAAVSLSTLCIVAVVVGRMRATTRRHPYLETGAVFAFIAAVSIGCALLLPGGG